MRTKHASTYKLPKPVHSDSRICFGIEYFDNETDAAVYAHFVRSRGDTYNGGYMHGVSCGRDTSFDFTHDTLGKLYAVTTR